MDKQFSLDPITGGILPDGSFQRYEPKEPLHIYSKLCSVHTLINLFDIFALVYTTEQSEEGSNELVAPPTLQIRLFSFRADLYRLKPLEDLGKDINHSLSIDTSNLSENARKALEYGFSTQTPTRPTRHLKLPFFK